jgi:hypothetical protein
MLDTVKIMLQYKKMTTQLIEPENLVEKTNKHIARIFQTGNSFGVRIPAAIAERYEFDRPGYALVQANGDKITVKRINEESLN